MINIVINLLISMMILFTELAYITSRSLLYEIQALQIQTCADRVYITNCN